MVGKGPTGYKTIGALVSHLTAGESVAQATDAALGRTPDALQKEVVQYVQRTILQYYVFDIAKADLDKRPPAEPMSAAERDYQLGDFMLQMDRFDEAKPYLERASAADPGRADAYAALGAGHLRAKDYAAASKLLTQAVERAPDDPQIRRLRARCRLSSGSIDDAAAAEAVDDLLKVVEKLPDDVWAFDSLGYLASAHDVKRPEAEAALRKGVALHASHGELLARLGDLLAVQQKYDEARDVFARAIALMPDSELRRNAERSLARLAEMKASK